MAEWQKTILPDYARRAEAKAGRARPMAYLVVDGQRVHTSRSMKDFYADQVIYLQTTAVLTHPE